MSEPPSKYWTFATSTGQRAALLEASVADVVDLDDELELLVARTSATVRPGPAGRRGVEAAMAS
jgi:hypothetical protein